jgi:predicted porin
MNKLAIAVGLLTLPVASAWAEPELYGKANVSFELVDEEGDTGTALQSNASRIGIKGKELFNDGFSLIYKLEYETFFDDGDKKGRTFTQRNIFVGVQSEWGEVIAGHFDTPFKQAQEKVDLFNDLRGDIKRVITTHENREANSVMYSTPESIGPFSANVAYIASEEEGRSDGTSASVAYNAGGFYSALAVDMDVEAEGTEAARLVSLYRLNNWQIGGLVDVADTVGGDQETGWIISGLYGIDNWAFKAQAGRSDIVAEGGETLSLGVDYRLAKNAKVFSFYTVNDSDEQVDANQYLGAGVELKF